MYSLFLSIPTKTLNNFLSSVIGRFSFFAHLLLDTEKFRENLYSKAAFKKDLPGPNRRLPVGNSCLHRPLFRRLKLFTSVAFRIDKHFTEANEHFEKQDNLSPSCLIVNSTYSTCAQPHFKYYLLANATLILSKHWGNAYHLVSQHLSRLK